MWFYTLQLRSADEGVSSPLLGGMGNAVGVLWHWLIESTGDGFLQMRLWASLQHQQLEAGWWDGRGGNVQRWGRRGGTAEDRDKDRSSRLGVRDGVLFHQIYTFTMHWDSIIYNIPAFPIRKVSTSLVMNWRNGGGIGDGLLRSTIGLFCPNYVTEKIQKRFAFPSVLTGTTCDDDSLEKSSKG